MNYDTHFAIGVQIEENGKWKGIASGRFIQDVTSPNEAEWAALVVDEKHGHKIGTCILYYLSVVEGNSIQLPIASETVWNRKINGCCSSRELLCSLLDEQIAWISRV